MTASIWIRDVGSVTLQLAAIVLAAALMWRLLRVRHSTATLAYWRALLVCCLLLPLCQPWRAIESPAFQTSLSKVVDASDVGTYAIASPIVAVAAPRGGATASALLLATLVAGMALRSLWLLLGAFSLRRLRRDAVPLDPLPPGLRSAERMTGTRAEVLVSDRVTSPITFGLRRPVVIVPPAVLAMDGALQEAIACHELVHVRRRDWLHVIAEEAIRTLFWFHPAIWWLIGRIHLTREHVVDEAVIRLTRSRDRYVEAMLAVALSKSPLVPTPVPLFLRRRFLKRRVAHLLQETTMTTRRLIASATLSAAVLGLTSVMAVRAFPIEARAPQGKAKAGFAEPVAVASGGENLLHGALPNYPERAVEQRIEGDVVLDLTIDERGEVSDARVASGPEELRRPALASVLQWHFSPDKVRSTTAQATLRFTLPSPDAEVMNGKLMVDKIRVFGELKVKGPRPGEYAIKYDEPKDEHQRNMRIKLQIEELTKALSDPSTPVSKREDLERKLVEVRSELTAGEEAQEKQPDPSGQPPRLARILTERVSPDVVKLIHDRAAISIGDPVTKETMKRIADVVESFDAHLHVGFERDGRGGLIVIIVAP